jgi:hypothetical protein
MKCAHKPSPDSGAYGHWECQRSRYHLGRHRFNNYTWRHGARLWGDLRFVARAIRLRIDGGAPWRVALQHTATKYQPTDLTARQPAH